MTRSKAESRHLARIKKMRCGVCGHPPPSDAHHPRFCAGMGQRAADFLAIPLCKPCHQSEIGIHGDKSLWKVYKKDEPIVLAETIGKLMNEYP